MKNNIIRSSSIFNTKTKVSQSFITASKDATANALDGNSSTSDQVHWNSDEHEYRFANTVRFKECRLTVTINQGDGWASDSNLDFYYIPPGKVLVAEYEKFANYNYPGMIDLTNYDIVRSVPGWVYADGIYIVFVGNNIEGGWATINEFNAYTTL